MLIWCHEQVKLMLRWIRLYSRANIGSSVALSWHLQATSSELVANDAWSRNQGCWCHVTMMLISPGRWPGDGIALCLYSGMGTHGECGWVASCETTVQNSFIMPNYSMATYITKARFSKPLDTNLNIIKAFDRQHLLPFKCSLSYVKSCTCTTRLPVH